MIKKLKNKIFLISFISLSTIIIGAIIIFAILNYHNTINTALLMINRMSDGGGPKGEPMHKPEEIIKFNIDGIYNIKIENGQIIENENEQEIDEEIKEYALKINKKRKDSGIIGKYVYRIRKRGENTYNITFMENEDAIAHANFILVFSSITCVIAIIRNIYRF